MSVGIYGNKTLSDVTFSDVDILYGYSPDKYTPITNQQLTPLYNSITNSDFFKLNGSDGAYNLRMPATIFNKIGIYTILITGKSYQTTVIDCSFVVKNTDKEIQISKKGIVIPKLQFGSTGSLIGYRVQYFNSNGLKINNLHKIITSSDLVSISVNNAQSTKSSSSSGYVLNPTGGEFIFITLSPDQTSLISANSPVDLGQAGQQIIISNTFFDPIMIEVEMVDQTIKTLSYGMFGNSTRDNEFGVFSIFDETGNLYKQYNLLDIKKKFSEGDTSVKQERSIINFSNQTFANLSQGVGS